MATPYEIWMHSPKTKMRVQGCKVEIRAKRIAANLNRISKGLLPPTRYTVRKTR